MANAPLPGTGWREQKADLVRMEMKIFLELGLDRKIGDLPISKSKVNFRHSGARVARARNDDR
jgi:hypothetical protein